MQENTPLEILPPQTTPLDTPPSLNGEYKLLQELKGRLHEYAEEYKLDSIFMLVQAIVFERLLSEKYITEESEYDKPLNGAESLSAKFRENWDRELKNNREEILDVFKGSDLTQQKKYLDKLFNGVVQFL